MGRERPTQGALLLCRLSGTPLSPSWDKPGCVHSAEFPCMTLACLPPLLPAPPAAGRRVLACSAGSPKWPRVAPKSGLHAESLLKDDFMIQAG